MKAKRSQLTIVVDYSDPAVAQKLVYEAFSVLHFRANQQYQRRVDSATVFAERILLQSEPDRIEIINGRVCEIYKSKI